MVVPIEYLEALAERKLKQVLSWSALELRKLKTELISVEETIEGEIISFDIFLRRESNSGKFRLVVCAFDDDPAKEVIPAMASEEVSI